MKLLKKTAACISALCISFTAAAAVVNYTIPDSVDAAETVNMEWDTVRIGGGGFVSGIVTGKEVMYARTDVGGAYKFNYETEEWEQLFAFLNDNNRGFLSVDAMAIDPTDDNTVYFLCGCAYFSGARTAVFKTTDGGKTFTQYDVTDQIQVHGNGYGRQCGESIAVDPDNPNIVYCGGDVASGESALIWSQDGGETWEPIKSYDDMGYYKYTVNWPFWDNHPVRGATTSSEQDYNQQNGVATINIRDGKVYVGTSILGEDNVLVADVGTNEFKPLCKDLPTNYYPSRIKFDTEGNLFISYLDSITLGKVGGGLYKYVPSTGELTDISPCTSGIGEVSVDKNDPNKMVAATCANAPTSQLWYENAWEDDNVAWGEQFFRSEDGGKTWLEITPGNKRGWNGPLMADYLQDGGFDWIRNKSIHWAGSTVLDPQNPDRFYTTSGNGIFRCDDIWSDLPVFTFHPNGIEEVVALDMISIPGGNNISAIGDYDGFIHTDLDKPGKQHFPNMGSTSTISYCPANPDVMVRYQENESKGYYTTDGGETWTMMTSSGTSGGKSAVTQLEDGTYRFFHSDTYGKIIYSDDFGSSWQNADGVKGNKVAGMMVEPSDPSIVYAYAAQYNAYWSSDSTKKEPSFDDANYQLMVSTDYGKTFTATGICKYDQCDPSYKIASLGDGKIVLGAGWNGAYISEDYGKTTKKLDNVFYCKTIGYGAPENEGDPNTLYMYGKPSESDTEGIYRSQDSGESWVCINTDKLYGGTANGNFLVGDMNEFGTVYMSTAGCGIVYGRLTDKIPETSTNSSSESTGETDQPKIIWGDTDASGKVEISDAAKIMSYVANPEKYSLSEKALDISDVYQRGDGVNNMDALSIQKYLVQIIKELPESYSE